ncbi:MAG: hypothetical protein JNK67_13805 [Alphaproteobacteria bacterium]|nr:hypothetical protein [Alphaproteobacteria bacterium]
MDLVTLVALCSVTFDPGLMHALVIAESEGKPWSFRGADGVFRSFPTPADAVRVATDETTVIRIGLTGLAIDPEAVSAQPIEGLLEPCPNVVLSSFRLARRAETCGVRYAAEPAERCALATYHASFAAPDWAFADAVITRFAVGDLPNPTIERPCDRASESSSSTRDSASPTSSSRSIFVPLNRDRR